MNIDALTRKYCDYLKISAKALIYFGIWGIVRAFFIYDSEHSAISEVADDIQQVTDIDSAAWVIAAIGLCIIIDLAFRLYVKRSVAKEIKGNMHNSFYLLVAVLYIIISIAIYVLFIKAGLISNSLLESISMILLDISTLVALSIIIVYAVRLRKIRSLVEITGEDIAG